MKDIHNLEILAPAGNMATLDAALAGGAHAVYFGIKNFNARLRADNFAASDLPEVMARLHQYGRKGYLTLNTLLFDSELKEVSRLIPKIIDSGVDALIITDLGLIEYIHCHYPQLPLHASTQLTTTNTAGCKYLERLGISRVVLARELSLPEISAIHAETNLEIEAFIHGAYCISYSGQCQASQALLGRSANRGLCAQLCRQKYQLGHKKGYLLSPHDLQGLDLLPQMVAAGVTSFKIEGRLKSPLYVYTVTKAYREALDFLLKEQAIPHDSSAALEQVFNRHPSGGYLNGLNHRELVKGDECSFQGLVLGNLLAIEPHAIYLLPQRKQINLNPGDGIAIGNEGSAVTIDAAAQGGRLFKYEEVKYQGQKALKLSVGPAPLDPRKFRPNLVVFKNQDNQLQNALEKAVKRPPEVIMAWPLAVKLSLTAQKLTIDWHLTYFQKRQLHYIQELTLPNGSTPLALFERQFSRLGGSPFYLQASCYTNNPKAEIIPVALTPGELNNLRRAAVSYFTENINKSLVETPLINLPTIKSINLPANAHYSILCRSREQLAAICQLDIPWEHIWLDYSIPLTTDTLHLVEGRPWGLALPFIQLPGETINNYLQFSPPALLIRTLGQLNDLQNYHGTLIGDTSLNCANPMAAQALLKNGLTRFSPAWEWYNQSQPTPLVPSAEQIIYTHRPLYLTRHCLLGASQGAKDCHSCGYCAKMSKPAVLLSADKKQSFTIIPWPNRYSILFSEAPEEPTTPTTSGYYRLELLGESSEEIASLTARLIKKA